MVIIKFQGGLGNQLFQYAFGLSISKRFRTFFLIDNGRNKAFFKYFKCRSFSRFPLINLYLVKLCRRKSYIEQYQEGIDRGEELQAYFSGNAYYNIFFQSEKYFENIRHQLKEQLKIKTKYKTQFQKEYGQLFIEHKILAVHCRLGDYLQWESDELGGKDLTLPRSYFENCFKMIKNLEQYKIIIVTDDAENVKERFNFLPEKLIFSQNEIMDFQILQNAHELIISNSTFSWWAAYLNNKSATVYAPKYWLGFKVSKEYPEDIIPDSWLQVSC